jgi:hypothetical protein
LASEDGEHSEALEVSDLAGLDVQPLAGGPEKGRAGTLRSRQEMVDEA